MVKIANGNDNLNGNQNYKVKSLQLLVSVLYTCFLNYSVRIVLNFLLLGTERSRD